MLCVLVPGVSLVYTVMKKKGNLKNCKLIAFSTWIKITDPVNKKILIIDKCVTDKYLRGKTMN